MAKRDKIPIRQAAPNDISTVDEIPVMVSDSGKTVVIRQTKREPFLVFYNKRHFEDGIIGPKESLKQLEKGFFDSYSFIISKQAIISRFKTFVRQQKPDMI